MTILLMDVENLYRSIGKRFSGRLDYDKYVKFVEERFGVPISVKMAYGSQKPRDAKSFISLLKMLGFTTRFDEGIDWNIPITLTAMELAKQGGMVIFGSNHKSLFPLVQALQEKGVRTFICGCCIHPILRQLSEYHEIDESLLITEIPEATEGSI